METPRITIFADRKEKELGDLFGIFFEDLNHAGDGGLYAEMVQNRSFEFDFSDNPEYNALTAWHKIERGAAHAEFHVETAQPLNSNNRHYLVMDVNLAGHGAGIQNQGYNSGMFLEKGKSYLFTCYYRRISRYSAPLRICLENADGTECYGETSFEPGEMKWTKVEFEITSKATDVCARLSILALGKITVALDMVSLFPKHTFKGRRNGLRADIAELLADMKPRFMRFPGGCLTHCGSIDPSDRSSMYRWKNTIGPVEERPTRRNRWNYNQTLGLGYYEYFLFCEDIGAKPIPVIPAGVDPHTRRVVPLDEMQPWIDEALDLIEFANGEVNTVWGSKRAEMGHPTPFGLEYLAIGNEEVGVEFFERYVIIHNAVREKYPEIKLIGSGGPGAAGSEYERGWEIARKHDVDYVDEHYYQSPEWLIANMHRYDDYSTDEPKVFLGEYSSLDDTYYNAIAEAAYLIGMEKAPAVGLVCYAPMLCNADYVNWNPNLIWFNNHEVYGTPCFHVQNLFMRNQGDVLLRTSAEGLKQIPVQASTPITGEIVFRTKNAHVDFADIQLTNLDTGEIRTFNDSALTPDSPTSFLDTVDWINYTLSFRAKKMDENSGTDVTGSGWFGVDFGRKDEENRLNWMIDGWMNLCILRSFTGGRTSELMNYAFNPEAKRFYDYRLEVRGRHIRTYIDGVLHADAEDKEAYLEELYYSASCDYESGDMIIKIVNLQDYDVHAEMLVDGIANNERSIVIHSLSDHSDGDRNSFENPNYVATKERVLAVDGNSWTYLFPKKSLSVLRVRQ